MSTFRVPAVYENQRIEPKDFNRLADEVTRLVGHIVQHALLDPDDVRLLYGAVLWGLQVEDASDLAQGHHRIKVNPGAALIPKTGTEPWALVLVDAAIEGPLMELPAVGIRNDGVTLTLTETSEQSEDREFRVVGAGGEAVELQPTPTYTRPHGAVKITPGVIIPEPGTVALGVCALNVNGITGISENRAFMWPAISGWSGQATDGTYVRGLRTGYERLREMIDSIVNTSLQLKENLAVHDGGPNLHLFDAGGGAFELDLGARLLRAQGVKATGLIEATGDVYSGGGDIYFGANNDLQLTLMDGGGADPRVKVTSGGVLGPATVAKFLRLGSNDAEPRAQLCQHTAPKAWGRITARKSGGATPDIYTKTHKWDETALNVAFALDANLGECVWTVSGLGWVDEYYSVLANVESEGALAGGVPQPVPVASLGAAGGAFDAVVYDKTADEFKIVARRAGSTAVIHNDLVGTHLDVGGLIINFVIFGDANGDDPILLQQ